MALTTQQANHLRARGIYTVGTTDDPLPQGGFMQTAGGKITSTQQAGWREALLAKAPLGKFGGA